MYELRRIDIENHKAIIGQPEAFVAELKDLPTVKESYLYRSFAKGE